MDNLRQHWVRPARLTGLPPLRAICAAITMQLSLGGRPHRSHRSHSPQTKAGRGRGFGMKLASLVNIAWTASGARIDSSIDIELACSRDWAPALIRINHRSRAAAPGAPMVGERRGPVRAPAPAITRAHTATESGRLAAASGVALSAGSGAPFAVCPHGP